MRTSPSTAGGRRVFPSMGLMTQDLVGSPVPSAPDPQVLVVQDKITPL
jgi:hypothetical protein